MQTSQNGKLAFTVTWRARDGEADACANIIPITVLLSGYLGR